MLNDVSFLLFRFVEEEGGEEQWRTRNDVFVGSNDYIYRHIHMRAAKNDSSSSNGSSSSSGSSASNGSSSSNGSSPSNGSSSSSGSSCSKS